MTEVRTALDSRTGGALLALVGLFLSSLTFRPPRWFWDSMGTRLLRRWFGDKLTSIFLYVVSFVLTLFGMMLAKGLIE
jgi:hypothetical protein